MRGLILLGTIVLSAAPLSAQPAADAPVAQHVAYLIDAARNGFAGASDHAMRFSGGEARSEVQVNPGWNVLHRTILPVAGSRAAADSAWARVADQLAAVIPAGWRRIRMAETHHAIWQECEQGRGREVSLATSLPFQQPALTLIIYRYDQPCPAGTGGAGSGG